MTSAELEQKIREIDGQIDDLYCQRYWLVIELHKAEMAEARGTTMTTKELGEQV